MLGQTHLTLQSLVSNSQLDKRIGLAAALLCRLSDNKKGGGSGDSFEAKENNHTHVWSVKHTVAKGKNGWRGEGVMP